MKYNDLQATAYFCTVSTVKYRSSVLARVLARLPATWVHQTGTPIFRGAKNWSTPRHQLIKRERAVQKMQY